MSNRRSKPHALAGCRLRHSWVAASATDSQAAAPAAERKATLEALRDQLLEQKYIANLIATIDREQKVAGGLQASGGHHG